MNPPGAGPGGAFVTAIEMGSIPPTAASAISLGF
jgi:hypothetical protein